MRLRLIPRSSALLCVACVLFFAAEFLLFDQIGAHHHTGIYPRWNDQIQYLTESYVGYEYARAHGLIAGLKQALLNVSAQGTLHDFWTILVFTFAGPSRSSALSLNMLAFIAWQIAVWVTVARNTRSATLGFTAAALLLTLRSGWVPGPGSAFDFRLDWFAACAMGVALAAAERTERFTRTGPSLWFGLAVGATLLTRFLTGTYFVLIYIAFAFWLVFRPTRCRSLLNLGLSGVVATAVAGPILWINRETVYNYYLIGHLMGPESALRSANMGVYRSSAWLSGKLLEMHIGAGYWIVSLAAFLAGMIGLALWPRRPSEEGFAVTPERPSVFPALAFAAVPSTVLILHIQKSEFVLAVILPGVASLVWWLISAPLRSVRDSARLAIAASVGAVAIATFAGRMSENPHSARFEQAARRVASVSDYIVKRAAQAGLASPRVAVDRVTDCLDAQVLRVIGYERQHRWIPFIMTLPTGIQEEDPKLYWERLHYSDFVFLTESGNDGAWPYDHQLARMRPETFAWADENLKRVDELDLEGVKMVLFERRDLH